MGDGTERGVNDSSFAPGTEGFNADPAQAIAYLAIQDVFHTFDASINSGSLSLADVDGGMVRLGQPPGRLGD